jgi:glycosyltransferase involved in cell wall biosynthesis
LKLSYEFPPVGGGGSAVVSGLAKALVSQGHAVDVVTMGLHGLPLEEIVDGIRVRRVDCGRRLKSKCTAREAARYVRRARPIVRELLSQNAYDIVHAHFIFPDGFVAQQETSRLGMPFVITAHGSDVPGYNSRVFFRLAHTLLRPLWNRVTGSARELVLPSRTLASLVARLEPDVRVRVIPNGIDADRYRPGGKKNQILVVSRLVERKGVQYLLRALAIEHPGWPVIVVGAGEYEGELLQLNEQLGRPATFVGWMDNKSDEFRKLMEQSAIYVLPSDFENASVALLEAMAAGAAIVTTRGHGCEETVGETAELVTTGRENQANCVADIRAAIHRLTRDPAHRAELGARGRRRVLENYTWDAVARSYLEVYEAHRARAHPQ